MGVSSFLFPDHLSTQPLPFLSKETELYTDVTEVSLQVSSGALHSNCASLQSGIFWNVDSLVAENGLHFHS